MLLGRAVKGVEGAGSFVPTATRSTNSLAAFWLFSSLLPSRVLHAFWEDGGVSREGPGLVCRSHLPPKRDWRMEERVRVCRCASASMPVLALSLPRLIPRSQGTRRRRADWALSLYPSLGLYQVRPHSAVPPPFLALGVWFSLGLTLRIQ